MAIKPLILISNDDGITAPGIRVLVEEMKKLGEVIVVAPNSPQSGMGHAITIGETLRLVKSNIFEGVPAYECSGTPADCIKLAKHHILHDRSPDLVVSGVNHGSNTSVSVLYSGTMSAAIEAAIEGLPAIGFSLCDYSHEAGFEHIREYIFRIAEYVLKNGLEEGVALNVNFPPEKKESIKGLRISRQAIAKWKEEFDERVDPQGQTYFWLTGRFINNDLSEETDEWAIANNYVSVVPCHYDLTAYKSLDNLKIKLKI
ncbi:MAG: 5'/3'-nucleotidase SurE [Cytophagales bacterium]